METQYTTLIERYFDEQLSQTEIAEYNQLLESNEDFQKEVELFEKAHQVVRLKHISDMKERVRNIRQAQTEASTSGGLGLMKIAASILLIAAVSIGFYAQQFETGKLYQEAYSPAGDYITNMDAEMTPLEKAMEFYNKGDFETAIDAFATIEGKDPRNQEAKFYLGQSLLQAGQNEQAIETLLEVSGDYHPEALWYAALTQLKTGKEADALETLNHIIDENEDEAFVLKARGLKSKLESPLRKLVF